MVDIPVNLSSATIDVVTTTDGQVIYDFDWLAYSTEQVSAIFRRSTGDIPLTAGIDFTVAGLSQPNGGSITLTTILDSVIGEVVTIYRATPIKRLNDYQQSGDYFAGVVNLEEDIQFMIMQELRRDTDRSVKFPLGSTHSSELPLPEAGKVLGWNDAANALINKTLADAGGVAFGAAGLDVAVSELPETIVTLLGLDARAPYVADRAALKALDRNKHKVAILQGADGGTFEWTLGNFSALVTADTTEGYVIKANSDAVTVGAWVRKLDGYDPCTVHFGNTQAGWQAAVNVAALLGRNVFAQGTCTLTSASIKLKPDVMIYNPYKMATLTQANAANLANLIDWPTNAALRAGIKGIVVDGNRANNTVDSNKCLLLQWDLADAFAIDCTLKNSPGMAVHNKAGVGTKILGNKITNCYGLFIYMSPLTAVLTTVEAEISDNVFDGDWSQHAIVCEYLHGIKVLRNKVIGFAQRGFNVTVTGTAVTSSGSFFSAACVGKFLIYNGGIEALIVGFTNANAVTINFAAGNCVTQPGVWGNGDVIGFTGCNNVLCAQNYLRGGASIGISIFSNNVALNSINNVVIDNTVVSMGSGAIIAQVSGGGSIFDTLIQGNQITDPGMNSTAAATAFNCGVKVAGGANVNRISVSNNKIIAYNGFMQWAVSYQAGVLAKVTTGGLHGGSINTTNNSVENP